MLTIPYSAEKPFNRGLSNTMICIDGNNNPDDDMHRVTCVSCMCSDGEKLSATHTNTTYGAGPVIHLHPLNDITTAAEATVARA